MTKYLSVLTLCLLAACAQNTETTPNAIPVSEPSTIENSASAIEPIVSVVEEAPALDESTKADAANSVADEVPEEIAVIEINVDDNPDQFLGSGLELISKRIGAPYFARRDGSIEVWQYQRDWQEGTCHFDLFLYPTTSGSSTILKVKYTELRSQFLSLTDQRACFAEMLRDQIRHHSTPTS